MIRILMKTILIFLNIVIATANVMSEAKKEKVDGKVVMGAVIVVLWIMANSYFVLIA